MVPGKCTCRLFSKAVSLSTALVFFLNGAVGAAQFSRDAGRYSLAPRSEGTTDYFKDLQDAMRAEEGRRAVLTGDTSLAISSTDKIYELRRTAESLLREAKVSEAAAKLHDAKQIVRREFQSIGKLYKEYLDLSGPEPVDTLVRAHVLLQNARSVYRGIAGLEDDIYKSGIVENMGVSFRKEFEKFAGKPVNNMPGREMDALITPFNALWLSRHNKAEIEQIARDGFFEVNYILDLFFDPLLDTEGLQAKALRDHGVIVGGDAVIVLRDDNGDIYLFEMDASGHGWAAAKILDAVIPFIFKKWEERKQGFLNEEFIHQLDDIVMRRREFKGEGLEYLPFNAVRIGAYDGKMECYSLGADPALHISGKGLVQKMRVEGPPLGLIEETGAISQRVKSVMKKGDRLMLHSDGLADARTPVRGMYSKKLHEFISAYVAQNQGLEMERAADEVLKKMRNVIELSPNEEDEYRRYISDKYESLLWYDEKLKEVFEKNPKLSPGLLTESILADIVLWTGSESMAYIWNHYVDTRLDGFLDSYAGANEALYAAVMHDAIGLYESSSENIKKPTDGARFADFIERRKGRYGYDETRNELSVRGAMTEDEKKELEALYTGAKELDAINRLYGYSRRFEHASYIGNSLKLLAFIRERIALPSDVLKQRIKEDHAAFSNLPVTCSEMVGDDLCLVNVLYKGAPKKKDLLLPDRSVGSIEIVLKDKTPSVFGDEQYAGVFTEICGPAPKNIPLNDLLRETGPVLIKIVEGKKLAYHKGNTLYVNSSLFMSADKLARMEELSATWARKWLSDDDAKAFKILKGGFDESVAAVQFVLYVNLLHRASRNESGVADWKKVYGAVVRYFLTLSRKSQDSLLALLRQFRKSDYLTDSFVRVFSQVKLTGVNQELDKEVEKSAAFVAQKDAGDRLTVILSEIAAGKDRWQSVLNRLASLNGEVIMEYDMDDEIQPLLTEIWGLVTDERTVMEKKVRQDVIAATKKVMNELIAARQRSLTATQLKFLAGAHELSPEDISILRGYFIRDLLSGDMVVKGLSFRNDNLVCRIKKGKQEFGTLALNDMRVYKRGTREYVIIDKDGDVPIVLEVDIETRRLSIRRYFDEKTYTFLFPEKEIEIKRPKLVSSGIRIRREGPAASSQFIAEGLIEKDGRLTIEKFYEPADRVRALPNLRSAAVAGKVARVFEKVSFVYPRPGRVRILFVSGNERSAATVAYKGRDPLIVLDIEGIDDPDLLFMDLEEEFMHLAIADMPRDQRPPLAMEEIMTALLKVYRFRSFSHGVKARILGLLRSRTNNLDDQCFYDLLSLPAALSHDAQIESIVKYVGRPGVYPEEVTAYLENRSLGDVSDELFGRIPAADGRRANWYSAIREKFPAELTAAGADPAGVLPFDELLSYVYRTHYLTLKRYIELRPARFLGIPDPYEQYAKLQTVFKDVLGGLDEPDCVRETLALVIVFGKLKTDNEINLFAKLYKIIGAVFPAYKALQSAAVAQAVNASRYEISDGLFQVLECFERGYDIHAELQFFADRLRVEMLSGRAEVSNADDAVRMLLCEGDRWFSGKGEEVLDRAVAYYGEIGRIAHDPALKYKAYARAADYFERLVKRDRIGDPKDIERLMPRMTIAVLGENGVFEDRPVGDLIPRIRQLYAESPDAARMASKMAGYYLYEAALRSRLKELTELERWWEESEVEGGMKRASQWVLYSVMLIGLSLTSPPVFGIGKAAVSGAIVQQPAQMLTAETRGMALMKAAERLRRSVPTGKKTAEKFPVVSSGLTYADMVSREEGFASNKFSPDTAKDSLDVIVLHAESFFKMKHDEREGKDVPVLKDLGSGILLKSLMQDRTAESARRIVWVSTTSGGERIRRLAGLPDGDLSVTPRGFAGDAAQLETDPDTAARFVAYVESEIDAAFRKGKDAQKKFYITVITEDVYFENIWRNDVRDFVFAILVGETALPSTALIAAIGDKDPEELKELIDRGSPDVIGIFPKPAIQDVDYLNELSRQSAELASNA
jgi:hypothetical protein